MLKGKELILATKPFAEENRKKSWLLTLSTFLIFLIMLAVSLFPLPIFIKLFSSILCSLLLVRLFIIYHDYLHKTILKKSVFAKVLFTIYGLYTLNPPSIWTRSHNYHHAHNSKLHTSNIGSFPILTKEKYLSLSKFERFKYLFIRHPLTIAFGYFFAFIWGMCLLSLIKNPTKHWDSAVAIVLHFSIGVIIYFYIGVPAFLFGFLIPAFISSAIGSYLFYAQHNFPSATFKNQNEWTYIDAALNSSSYMKMNRLLEWFTGYIGYHHIHHTNAHIPFYRLKEVYNKVPEFQNAKTTSLKPIDIYKCLRIKVWDSNENRMLRLNEI